MSTQRPEILQLGRHRVRLATALALVIAMTTLASFATFGSVRSHPVSDSADVRVSVLKSDDGTVRVGVQALAADGQWGERQLPSRRVISATSPTNTWLRSSPVTLDSGGALAPLFCVVAHGATDDRFWLKFRAYLHQSANLSNTNLRFETHLQGHAQAAAIERCIADGAAVIASTLASPEDVREPLKRAKEAGLRVVTFNAGVEHAESVGSEIHIALNDRAAGELAGQQFNERGISGQVGCLIHERDNLSLEHRCDGLEAAYQGDGVTRIQLVEAPANLQGDYDDFLDQVASELADHEGSRYDAVLTLNGDTLRHALTAVQRLGNTADGLRIASVGVHLDDLRAFPDAMLEQHLDALISDSFDAQGHFVAGALQLSYNLHNAAYISQPQPWLADPALIDHQSAQANTDAFKAISVSLERMLDQSMGDERRTAGVTVRVAALKRDNGSVVFAIEAKGADGRWRSPQLPRLRVLSADAPSGHWLASSAVELPSLAAGAPLFCVVTHGSRQDRYWQVARAYMHISAHVTDTNWRYEAHLDGADQAAAIDQCSADGAAVIASTLADPDAVTDSLLAAKQAGARIVTFNSGGSFAEAAGSEIHVALDDREAGAAVGRRINQLGITGPIACVIHEANNVGLVERCEGLEATYAGAGVTRLQLTEGAADAQVVEELVSGLTAPDSPEFVLALTLNANTLFSALDAASQIYADSGHTIKVVPIGTHVQLARTPLEWRMRHLLSPFNDSVESQGFLVVSAMHFVHNHHTPPEFIDSPQLWLATPFAINPSRLQANPEAARTVAARLLQYVAEATADDQ